MQSPKSIDPVSISCDIQFVSARWQGLCHQTVGRKGDEPLLLSIQIGTDHRHGKIADLDPGLFSFCQDCEETDPLVLAKYPGVDPETLISGSREPLSFGMVVLAVILGVVGAVFLLMLL